LGGLSALQRETDRLVAAALGAAAVNALGLSWWSLWFHLALIAAVLVSFSEI
jgi:hypothetical protein